jgi:hypothetical protein
MKVNNHINPADPLVAAKRPLWAIHGSTAYPEMLCCKINFDADGPVIWGFSRYKNSPKFRTLGISLDSFVAERKNVFFFANIEHALDYMRSLMTPPLRLLDEL